MKVERKRKIVLLNLVGHGPATERTIELSGIQFSVIEHQIGWDVNAALELMKKYDGYADAIAISGIQKRISAGRKSFLHPISMKLLRAAVKTPIYLADYVRDLFSDWTLQKVLKEQPHIFQKKKVLFHCAVASSFIRKIEDAGGTLHALDPMLMPGLPVVLRGMSSIENYAWTVKASAWLLIKSKITPRVSNEKNSRRTAIENEIKSCDVFVTFSNLIEQVQDFSVFRDKVVIIDFLPDSIRDKLEAAQPAQIIVFTPEHPQIDALNIKHYSVFSALIDQIRLVTDSALNFDDFLLRWIQMVNMKPRALRSSRGIVRRCAFVVHPLNSSLLWNNSGIPYMHKLPETMRTLAEKVAAHTPVIRYGTIEGIISAATGQEVACDLYAIPATPKQLLAMDEEFLYRRMVQASEDAKRNGAIMMGLGAYTKVVGDAGTTIARRAVIPVTNGNSYSASATLWAAKEMLVRMGLVKHGTHGKVRAKAMIVGATGSIGRVSALLISLVVDELVLVATRPDKLLELRQEVQDLSPHVRVHVTTNPDPDLGDTDLIVTATSNQGGTILDIMKVKPGAVICDCSRPLDIGPEEAAKRPDVLVIESGEIMLPGQLRFTASIGLPEPSVYACLAETVLLTMEGRYESFSLSKHLSLEKVKEIYKMGIKHGAKLSDISGPNGPLTEDDIERCRTLALQNLKSWNSPGLTTLIKSASEEKTSETEPVPV